MTLRLKLMGVSITVLFLPLIVILTFILIALKPMYSNKNVKFGLLPSRIVTSVINIIENSDDEVIEVNDNIYALYLEDSGFIYLKEDMDEEAALDMRNNMNSTSGYPDQLLTDYTVGLSRFTYYDNFGIVFLRLDAVRPVNIFKSNIQRVILFLSIFAILIPVLISWFFLISLSRTLSTLEKGAMKITSGLLSFDLIIPKDKTLVPLFTAFEDMKNELKDSYDSRKRFLLAISHDLKTPLTSIKGYIEVLEDGLAVTPEKQSQYLGILREKSELLEQRLLELIEFAKIETIDWQRKFCDFDGNRFFSNLIDLYSKEAEIKKRTLKYETDIKDSILINGDEKMLYRVFENLFENAFRYTYGKGIIKISLSVRDHNLEFLIEDDGPGIQEQEQSLIFEPFYRAETSRNSKGIGLGLNSARSIINAHKGIITLENSSMGGAAFKVIIPVKRN